MEGEHTKSVPFVFKYFFCGHISHVAYWLEFLSWVHRGCPKAYHPSCVNRDEAFFKSKGRWNCGKHFSVSPKMHALFDDNLWMLLWNIPVLLCRCTCC